MEFDGQEKGSPGGSGAQCYSRSAALHAHSGAGVCWQLPPLKVFDSFLIVIDILPFLQSFCKKRAGFTSLLVFCLSHRWAGKRQWGALGSWSS